MNPDSLNPQPSTELPKPTLLETPRTVVENQPSTKSEAVELNAVHAEQPGSATLQPLALPVPSGLPMQAPPVKVPISQTVQSTYVPSDAADTDLIEKEWVIRAKALVENTKEDPHLQNKEMSKFKADYIKKRYNKDVKVSEE